MTRPSPVKRGAQRAEPGADVTRFQSQPSHRRVAPRLGRGRPQAQDNAVVKIQHEANLDRLRRVGVHGIPPTRSVPPEGVLLPGHAALRPGQGPTRQQRRHQGADDLSRDRGAGVPTQPSTDDRSRQDVQQKDSPPGPGRGDALQLDRRRRAHARQTRRNTRVPLVPPKPKLFFTATSMRIDRATLAQ